MFDPPEGPAAAPVRKLPPIALLFLIAGAARSVAALALFVLVSQRNLDIFMIAFLALATFPAVFGAVARYLAFSYRLGEEELVIRDGILTRKVRSVPYGRIQNVDLVQNLFHRLLDVAVVRLETASGGKPEAVIKVLTLGAVEELRNHIQHRKQAPSPGAPAEVQETVPGTGEALGTLGRSAAPRTAGGELLHVGVGRLVVLGLLSNRGMLVVAAAAGLAQQAGFFDHPDRFLPSPEQIPQMEGWIRNLESLSWNPFLAVTVALLAITGFVIVTRLLSALWVTVTLFDFRLRLDNDDLRTEYGLLTKVTATVPRRRVQLLSVRESFLQKRWGLASVQIESAGGGGDGETQGPGAARLWLAPLMDRSGLDEIIRRVAPQMDLGPAGLQELDWQPLASRARRRMIRRGSVAVLLLTGVAAAILRTWSVAFLLLLLVPVVIYAVLFIRHTGWAINDRAVFYRSGAWGRYTSMVPFSKIQGVRMRQNPFDRRVRMAGVKVDTAGAGQSGHRVEIPYLEVETARQLAKHLESEAAQVEFRW